MSSYWSRYCCNPFKHHRRRIYSHLRVVPASLIAEHPSLSLQSGVVACCNCLKAIRECSPESRAPDVPLLECAGPSNEHAGSSNERAGPSNERAGPSNERAGPSNERAGPSNERAGPSNERAGPGNERSDPRASPSTIPSTPTLSENSDDDSDAVPDLLKRNETLSTHGISPVHNKKRLRCKSYVSQKVRKLEKEVVKSVQLAVGTNSEFVHQDDGAEVIKQLKEKFVSTKSRSERIRQFCQRVGLYAILWTTLIVPFTKQGWLRRL